MQEMPVDRELTPDMVLPLDFLCRTPLAAMWLRAAYVIRGGVTYKTLGDFAVGRGFMRDKKSYTAPGQRMWYKYKIKQQLLHYDLITETWSYRDPGTRKIFQITGIGRRVLHLYDNTDYIANDTTKTRQK